MGGRKGYSLKKIVGNTRKIKDEKKNLLDAIEHNDVKGVVSSSAKILAKSDEVLESLAHSFVFIGSLEKDYNKLRKESTKARKLDISKKWAKYRKEKGIEFEESVNRNIVDTATRTLGGTK